MKVVAISDTHGVHERLAIPACDLLVHCGDVTRGGSRAETEEFLDWFAAQPARDKLFVGGNHDRFVEKQPDEVRRLAERHGVAYLFDEEITFAGKKIWGSPVVPPFRSMAFNRERGATIRAHWDRMPAGLDLLVTHGPPKGLGDRIVVGIHVGCADLTAKVRSAAPRVHVFGHIHEARGEYSLPGLPTRFLNVASRRLVPIGIRPPVAFEI